MTSAPSRRTFLKQSAALGGGLVIGMHLPDALGAGAAASAAAAEVNAWVLVRPDDSVIIRYARAEMGQGSFTALPMLVAEELECDWNKVRVEYATAHENLRRKRVWGNMYSTGSRSVRESQEYLRKAGAAAREMLIAAAAQKWGVPASECVAASGVITHVPSKRRTRFGRVANHAAKLDPPKDVKLKDPKDWKLLGQPVRRFDIPASTTGRQVYGIDVQLPGMVYAAAAQCPVYGGKVKSFDASKVQGRRGIIKVVSVDIAVAVIADNWWRAKEALKDVAIEWDDGGNGKVTSASIAEFIRAGFNAPDAPVARRSGDVDLALASAAKVIEAEYATPYLAHSTLEPMVCTAMVKDGKVQVWTSTQTAEATLAAAAGAAGVKPDAVEVHAMQCGGGFGRRGGAQDYTRLGVRVAKAMEGTPVKLLWTREDDTRHDFYRPSAMYRLKAGLDASGKVTGWTTRVASPSILVTLNRVQLKDGIDVFAMEGFSDFPYGVPSVRMEYAMRNPHVPVGNWRSIGHSQTPFARECFLDELAYAAGRDPYEFRRSLLADKPKNLALLDAVAKKADWGKPLPAGVFRGIAMAEPYGSYSAAVIEISIDGQGGLRIHRVVNAIDPGHVVNPDTVVAQTQGNVVFGLTAALWGEITIEGGRAVQSNFHDYRMMRIGEMPTVEVVIAPSGGFWGGVGEPGFGPLAPALCNAIFAATGRRIRSLPLKNQGITLVKA